jgi:hypothetical protein
MLTHNRHVRSVIAVGRHSQHKPGQDRTRPGRSGDPHPPRLMQRVSTIHRTELARATLHAARIASRWDLLALPIEPCSRGMALGDNPPFGRSKVAQVRAPKCPDPFSEGHTGCFREWRRGARQGSLKGATVAGRSTVWHCRARGPSRGLRDPAGARVQQGWCLGVPSGPPHTRLNVVTARWGPL